MKVKRYKRANKVLEYYTINFGLHRPYQVLLDATFCAHALKFQVTLREHVPKYLQDETAIIVTTACVLQEIQSLGAPLNGVLTVLKQFQLRKCLHSKTPVSASRCIFDCVREGNPNHFIVATQDAELSERVRRVVGVPLLYFHLHSITLEKPSALSQSAHLAETEKKLSLTAHEHEVLKKLNAEILGKTDADTKKTIRKKVRGPNPLSVKKKTKKPDPNQRNNTDKTKNSKPSNLVADSSRPSTSMPRSRSRKRRRRTGKGEGGDPEDRKLDTSA